MCLHAQDIIQYHQIFEKVNSTVELTEKEIQFLEKHGVRYKFELHRKAYLLSQTETRGDVLSLV